MLFRVCMLLVLLDAACYDYEDDIIEDYGAYIDDDETSTTPSSEQSTINRIRRYGAQAVKTLSPEDVREVRGALKQLFSGMTLENPFTPYTTTYNDNQTVPTISTISTITTHTTNTTNQYITDVLTEIIKITNAGPTWGYQLRNKGDLREPTDPTETTPNTNTTTRKKQDLDIPRLLAIISDLASEFESNLTRKLNETLMNMTLPTCTTPTPTPRVTSEYDANYTGSVIAKCYVCGLSVPSIPRHAHCADAFAGDFLPLVPVDPTSKGKISRFKKYCMYSNVPGYQLNVSQPRVILGRWTGGCAVRWIDLSGVYTQRTCRNRLQPTMGIHFASKRMAKLERSLWNIENGCIISPMATLVPLSRGISLYARFHACVCTGSWCNMAIHTRDVQYLLTILVMLLRIT